MVKFKDFSRPLRVFQVLSSQILFSSTFQDSPVYSSTFQACANSALASMHNWAGCPDPSLLDNAFSCKISCTGSNMSVFTMLPNLGPNCLQRLSAEKNLLLAGKELR